MTHSEGPERVGVYPGSFNPPTLAHLAIAEAARSAGALDRVDLVVSEAPLGKAAVLVPSLADRLAVLRQVVAERPYLGVQLTAAQLLVDIAAGAAAIVLGADKWAQINEPVWYGGSPAARDEALARLPLVLLAPRAGWPMPADVPGRVVGLVVSHDLEEVSSTGARGGRLEWMAPEAAAFDRASGAWSEPDRYRATQEASHHPERGRG